MGLKPIFPLILLLQFWVIDGEIVQKLRVEEGVPAGTVIGRIGEARPGLPRPPPPPYLIVPLSGPAADSDLSINPHSGEIRTKGVIDREKVKEYLKQRQIDS